MRPARMVAACVEQGINVLAITDHNEFEGALEMAANAPFTVIPGEEILTTEGEIIGYFLREWIPRGLSAETAAQRVREQGGIVNVPHPFDSLRHSRLQEQALDSLVRLGLVDMIEVLNARVTRPADNDRAREYARRHDLPFAAGSDAHTYAEIGVAWMELRPFDGAQDFVQAVREGRLCGGLSPWPVHLVSTWAKAVKKMKATGLEMPHR